MPKSLWGVGVGVAGVGSAILTMKPDLTVMVPSLTSEKIALIGVVITVLGLILLLVWAVTAFKTPVTTMADSVHKFLFKNWLYTQIQTTVDDLPALFSDFKKVFGEDIAPIEEMTKWLNRNDTFAWRVMRSSDDGKRENVGFFELIPITGSAVKKIEAGQLDGRTLTTNHIVARRSKAPAYYVGSIAAVNQTKRFKFSTMFVFLEHLRQKSTKSAITLYARPVTTDGLRLVKDYKFKQLDPRMRPEESVWKVVLPKGSDFSELERIYNRALKGATFASA